jgi:inosine-uridine nucleoside N-ribohydrolase
MQAAKLVFESGVPLTMVPLEVTHTALVTPEVRRRILSPPGGPTPFLDAICALLLFFAETYRAVFNFVDPPLHDPCAVAFIVAPELFTVERLNVEIETCSRLSAGQTVVDVWRQTGRAPNVDVCTAMDVSSFWDLMIAAIHAASASAERRNAASAPGHGAAEN